MAPVDGTTAALGANTGRTPSKNTGASTRLMSLALGLCTPYAYSTLAPNPYVVNTRLPRPIDARHTRGAPNSSPNRATLGVTLPVTPEPPTQLAGMLAVSPKYAGQSGVGTADPTHTSCCC